MRAVRQLARSSWSVALGVLAVVALAPTLAAAQGPAEPAAATVEVTVWRRVSNPSLLYLSTRPEGGRWTTENTALDMSSLSSSGRFHQSNAILVEVPLSGGTTANIEVTVWRRVSNPSLLYLSTRPEGGRWRTENTALDMSALSSSRRFHQSNAVLVEVPLPDAPPPAATCVYTEAIERVAASTFQVQTVDGTGTAFYIGDGEWITNHHVVESASTVWLLHGETQFRAQVTGTLPDYDLAMLSATPEGGIAALTFTSERPRLASSVTIVGFPYGVVGTPSVTRGVVSKHLPFTQLPGFASDGVAIQFDAAGNPGNSGGPVVDDCGRVVGVLFGGLETTPGGRPLEGLGFGIAAETAVAQLANLRSAGHGSGDAPEEQSYLTISAFCTLRSGEDLNADECHDRSHMLDRSQDEWLVWVSGVEDFDNVVYRFNEGSQLLEDEVWDGVRALGDGCHELEMAEHGISTHWSPAYEFCFARSTDPPSNSALAAPAGLWVAKIDIPAAPDDIRVTWNAVEGALWYELFHAAGDEDWQFKATVTNTVYVDTAPSWLYPDHYTLRACNADGCSEFSSVATQD